MKFRREGFEIVLRKRYFQPQELIEILNKDAEEIKRIACVAEALYRVENLYLVDYQKIYTFICNNLMFYENQDGRYVTAAEAARNRKGSILRAQHLSEKWQELMGFRSKRIFGIGAFLSS